LPVAVLIVNYRVYAEVDRALSSLEPFLRADDDVIVIDQATDRAGRNRLAARHPRAAVVGIEDNRGFAAAVNLAARHTTAPYLLLLNPDAVVEGPIVEILERWLHDHPETSVVGPLVLDEDGSVQASARRRPGLSTAIGGRSTWLTRQFPANWLSQHNLPGRDARQPMEVDWIAASCLMTRRDLFERLGGLDESFFLYWEDADYCQRAMGAGTRCVYLPDARGVRHKGGASAAADPVLAIRAFHRSAFLYYKKHAGPVARLLSPLVGAGLWLRGEIAVWRTKPNRAGRRPTARG
jgi:GT2 family glycosyltransferase